MILESIHVTRDEQPIDNSKSSLEDLDRIFCTVS